VITVIGPVVDLRGEIAWFDRRPLFGKRIVVTRAQAQASALTERLAAAGAEVIEMPATRIEPCDLAGLRDALGDIAAFDWIVFTSQNAVQVAWDALRAMGLDARAFAGVKIAAVGPMTADALLQRGLAVDVVPERFVAEGLLDALRSREDVRGARVLYVAGEGARKTLERGLIGAGASVERVTAYRSVVDGTDADSLKTRLDRGDVDLATFTSASSVRAFVDLVGAERARRVPAASIGPITTEAARDAGLDVAIEATTSTIDGLVESIVESFASAGA
jgi:uroporphyrinogen III methyltransferase/synthase